MNYLIIANKNESKLYTQVLKKEPNITVLGSVNTVTSSFFSSLKTKWTPHAILYDTSTVIKVNNTSASDMVHQIKAMYPYIKIILLADESDYRDYSEADRVLKGRISNTEFLKVIKSVDSNENTVLNNYSDGSGQTEKLYRAKTVDELSSIKISYTPTKRKKKPKISMLQVAIIAGVSVFILLIATIVIKSASTPTATSDEAVETTSSGLLFEEQPTIEETTIEETTVEPTVQVATALAVEENVAISAEPETEETTVEQSSKSQAKAENSKSNSSSSNKSDSSSSSSSNNNNSSSSSNNNSSSNNAQTSTIKEIVQGDPYYSYDDYEEYNNGNNATTSIKLSYSKKTLNLGENITITATVSPTNKTVNWSTDNSSVASINNSGVIYARSRGTARITATVDGVQASCTITVI